MKQETMVLCGASAYTEKYYLNPEFASLPDAVKDELKILCVLYTHAVGGVLTLEFEEDGTLEFRTEAKEDDFRYDEIGGVLEIRRLQREKQELLEELELYYKVKFLGMIPGSPEFHGTGRKKA